MLPTARMWSAAPAAWPVTATGMSATKAPMLAQSVLTWPAAPTASRDVSAVSASAHSSVWPSSTWVRKMPSSAPKVSSPAIAPPPMRR